jgi:hypothetical protein
MKTWRSGDIAPPLLTHVRNGGEWAASCPGRFTPGQRAPGSHSIVWVGPRAGLDAVEKRKNPAPVGNQTPAVQPVAHRYTDCTNPAHHPDIDVPKYAELHFSLSDKGERGRLAWIDVLFGGNGIIKFENPWTTSLGLFRAISTS